MDRVEIAKRLGRPIQHNDYYPINPVQFAVSTAQSRGWGRPTERNTEPVMARLDAGSWLADCPLGCGGAETVDEAQPLFLCLSCGSGMKWWPVVFPVNREAIDAEVSKRRDPHGWAWATGESMDDLRKETAVLKARGLA